jgi:hypothetical protein
VVARLALLAWVGDNRSWAASAVFATAVFATAVFATAVLATAATTTATAVFAAAVLTIFAVGDGFARAHST